jgi:hypothetical protein
MQEAKGRINNQFLITRFSIISDMSNQETKLASISLNARKQSVDFPQNPEQPLLVEELEWSETEVKESYYHLQHLENDWNAPKINIYYKL